MIYILYELGKTADWDTLRMFTSFSSLEQTMIKNNLKSHYAVAYDGVDELVPVWSYQLVKGILQRFSL
jgi:hypothetical protein